MRFASMPRYCVVCVDPCTSKDGVPYVYVWTESLDSKGGAIHFAMPAHLCNFGKGYTLYQWEIDKWKPKPSRKPIGEVMPV